MQTATLCVDRVAAVVIVVVGMWSARVYVCVCVLVLLDVRFYVRSGDMRGKQAPLLRSPHTHTRMPLSHSHSLSCSLCLLAQPLLLVWKLFGGLQVKTKWRKQQKFHFNSIVVYECVCVRVCLGIVVCRLSIILIIVVL